MLAAAPAQDAPVRIAHVPGVSPMLDPNVPASWFEISTSDLDRAQRFYEAVLGTTLARNRVGATELAMFPFGGRPGTGGALIRQEDSEPSVQGCVVYLNVDDLDAVLTRALAHGADVFVPRTELPGGRGVYAQFLDSEGNRVGLWSAR